MADAAPLTVAPEQAGQRLDQFLAAQLNRSRGEIQRKIRSGEILVDGHAAEKDLRVDARMHIEVAEDHALPPPAAAPNPTIVYEDEAVLVLNKPSGLVMHPAAGVRERTLTDWLVQSRPDIARVGDDPIRPGLVHRLDREASGLVVVAKTTAAFHFLKTAFQEHRVEKKYLALVQGNVLNATDTIRFPIERSSDGTMAAQPIGGAGREAQTDFTVLEHIPPFTLLEVMAKTGRTHQIRVHLQAYGHPIAGDPLYHPRKRMTKLEPPRLFLHAASLRFPHPDGSVRTMTTPLPAELEDFLRGLRPA